MDYFQVFNGCKYLSLTQITEIRDNGLELLIEEGFLDEKREDLKISDQTISDVREVIIAQACRKFEIKFERYLGYSVRNESFTIVDDHETYDGSLYRIYQTSHFLDYTRKTCSEHFGAFKHYGFICTDHIIDVVSSKEPVIRTYR